MAQLELLASPPGTGKTFHCIELFRKALLRSKGGIQSRSFFVLPSREHADRIQQLVLRKEVQGLFNAHILTINDLAARLLGVSALRPPSESLRKAAIREILFENEGDQKNNLFRYFNEVKDFHGFHELLAEAIKEFRAGFLSVEQFQKAAQPLLKDASFRVKYKDFSILLKKYETKLRALGLRESEDSLRDALNELSRMKSADLVIFDGFYRFTNAQLALIKAIGRWSTHTVATLTLPRRRHERIKLFAYPERTRDLLLAAGFKESKGLFTKNQRTKDAALLHLEDGLFSDDPKVYPRAQQAVTLIEAADQRGEIELIAREIRRLHRETACHFSDICLVLRHVGDYEKPIQSIFESFQIPVHIHERKKLIENGLVTALYRFLALGTEGWKREDLFFILKSSFFIERLPIEEILRLESISFADNVSEGKAKWLELSDRSEVSKNLKKVLSELTAADEILSRSENIRGFNRQITACMEYLLSGPRKVEPALYVPEAYEAVLSILRSNETYFEKSGIGNLSSPSFSKSLQESLEAGLYTVKPKGKNRVQVYDVVMALSKEYKTVFIPGLLEKSFPLNIVEDPLFKDRERRVINKKTVVLEERLERIAGERYFFYMAVTRAKEKLYLSHPKMNPEGKPALTSFFIEEVERCFKDKLPLLNDKKIGSLSFLENWERERDVTRCLAENIFQKRSMGRQSDGKERPELLQAWNHWIAKQEFKDIAVYGRSLEEARIMDPKIKQFFRELKGPFSATKLEVFAACAFKFFSGRVLDLNETLEGREALEMGNLLHKTLEEFYKGLSSSEKESGSFLSDPPALKTRLHKTLREKMAGSPLGHEPLYRQKMYEGSMKATLDLFAEHEKELFAKRNLVPSYFELNFGRPGKGALDHLRVRGSDGDIFIEGQIDRVDISKDKTRALVIDYKRSGREFKVHEKLAKGLEFQLPIYILAVQRLLGLQVAGAELRLLREASLEGIYRASDSELLGLHPKARTYDDNAFEKVLQNTENLIVSNLKRLNDADISVKSKTCKFCSFSPVCRFEPWRLVYSSEEQL